MPASSGTASLSFLWSPGRPPQGMSVVQVYGWLFDSHGRVLVQRTPEGLFNLPGGSPEHYDADPVATLVREVAEESQARVEDVAALGFEERRTPGERPVALLRMVARLVGFDVRRPDVDGGRLLERHMTTAASAPGLLRWGRSGVAQAEEAANVAEAVWGLPARAPTAAAAEIP